MLWKIEKNQIFCSSLAVSLLSCALTVLHLCINELPKGLRRAKLEINKKYNTSDLSCSIFGVTEKWKMQKNSVLADVELTEHWI